MLYVAGRAHGTARSRVTEADCWVTVLTHKQSTRGVSLWLTIASCMHIDCTMVLTNI